MYFFFVNFNLFGLYTLCILYVCVQYMCIKMYVCEYASSNMRLSLCVESVCVCICLYIYDRCIFIYRMHVFTFFIFYYKPFGFFIPSAHFILSLYIFLVFSFFMNCKKKNEEQLWRLELLQV